MRSLLVQQDLLKVLSSKGKLSESMSEDKKELEMKAYSTIQLYLADEILWEVADEDTAAGLLLKLESFVGPKAFHPSFDDD